MQVQDLVTLVPWTFIAQICNLFIQIWLVKKFLLKPINEVLEKRRQKADAEIREAEKAKTEAYAIKDQYERNMEGARKRASDMLSDAQKNAAAKGEKIVQEAEAEAAQIRAKAANDIAQERKKAINEAKDEIGGIAMEIAGKVIEREINEDDHRKLIDEFIKNVGEAS